jgi:GTP-binding protein Era
MNDDQSILIDEQSNPSNREGIMQKKFAAIVLAGEPNAGKSTLLNQLIGEKLSIVCHKAQTTRRSITGIFIYKECQVLVYDTPGLFQNPKSILEKRIAQNALSTIKDNEHIYLLIDANDKNIKNMCNIFSHFDTKNLRILLNKIDLVDHEMLDGLLLELQDYCKKIIPISALTGHGILHLKEDILESSALSEWMFPEDEITTIPERELAADITREKIFFAVHQELPYELEVETEHWKDTKNIVNIHQVIYTKRNSHKMILLGKGGVNIKHIGMQSRRELESILGKQVNLKLFIKVRPNWEEYVV